MKKNYAYLDAINLDASKILENELLQKSIIYLTENTPTKIYCKNVGTEDVIVQKNINLVFSRECLSNNKDIPTEIQNIVEDIEREIILVKEDRLHRGDYISYQKISFIYKDDLWTLNSVKSLKSSDSITERSEYWNTTGHYFDFTLTSTKFPWLDIEISKDFFPF